MKERSLGISLTANQMAIATGVIASMVARGVPSSVQSFAARLRVEQVSISLTGRYVSVVEIFHGRAAAVVLDR